ncbi:demethylmenaquinone methyltransferase / 2-methoxy-6-polyprenyl-1,4-benzoquinol methylase protein [Dioscorea alata]|uniref:Demethylmenaquinone methyltransferase / 2-methoxy-6-polyprenyl-1,4-benzoquinol methylase protein n=1 Tax=Dioscorea alata TaxID=55571 RepID=A0ACB7UF63_DIOAL|nr:demethylmenaquinone methyltransferase / 2-methoxy-6-polyprenyl-1,4-benzoquinol methylase protein [Dioscorea alata]
MMMMISTSMAAASSLGGIISSASSSSRTSIQCCVERQALFNRIAPVYDGLNDVLSLGQHRLWKRMSVTWSGFVCVNRAKKGDSVLDLCCGSGDLTFLLSHYVGLHGQVSALDFSSDQLSIASSRQELNWKACYDNIKWIEGDALDLPFSSSSFDAITMGYGLRNLVDRKKAMQEIFRVLKPGSRASILDFNKSTSAIATMFQVWMMDNVVVPVASTYGLADEYRYLRDSINDFLTGKELEELAKGVGFNKAKHYELGGGLMGNLVVTK